MLRAHFKSRTPCRNPPVALSTRPAPDLFGDGDTPSLPSIARSAAAELPLFAGDAWQGYWPRTAGRA